MFLVCNVHVDVILNNFTFSGILMPYLCLLFVSSQIIVKYNIFRFFDISLFIMAPVQSHFLGTFTSHFLDIFASQMSNRHKANISQIDFTSDVFGFPL